VLATGQVSIPLRSSNFEPISPPRHETIQIFWSVAALTELRFYLAIAERKLTGELDTIIREFDDLHARVGSSTMWGSVLDQTGFVLPTYERRATATEKDAAARLRKYLEKIAVRSQ
jgi:hypothetical protein